MHHLKFIVFQDYEINKSKSIICINQNVDVNKICQGGYLLSAMPVSRGLSWNISGSLHIPKDAASNRCTITSVSILSFKITELISNHKLMKNNRFLLIPAYLLMGEVKCVYTGAARP